MINKLKNKNVNKSKINHNIINKNEINKNHSSILEINIFVLVIGEIILIIVAIPI